jgi:hypothetical protein
VLLGGEECQAWVVQDVCKYPLGCQALEETIATVMVDIRMSAAGTPAPDLVVHQAAPAPGGAMGGDTQVVARHWNSP